MMKPDRKSGAPFCQELLGACDILAILRLQQHHKIRFSPSITPDVSMNAHVVFPAVQLHAAPPMVDFICGHKLERRENYGTGMDQSGGALAWKRRFRLSSKPHYQECFSSTGPRSNGSILNTDPDHIYAWSNPHTNKSFRIGCGRPSERKTRIISVPVPFESLIG